MRTSTLYILGTKTRKNLLCSAFLVVPLVLIALLTSGCNFFGKEATEVQKSTGSTKEPLPTEYVGTWVYVDLLTSETNTPGVVYYTRMQLNQNNTVSFTFEDLVTGGQSAALTGQVLYDSVDDELLIGFDSGTDPFNAFLGKVYVYKSPRAEADGTLSYRSSQGAVRYLYKDKMTSAITTFQGVWRFNTQNLGIDFAVLTNSGLGVIQTRDNGDPVLIDFTYANTQLNQFVRWDFFYGLLGNILSSLEFNQFTVDAADQSLSVNVSGVTDTAELL